MHGELGLKLTRILRGGFGYVRPDASGKPRIVSRDCLARLGAAGRLLGDVADRTGSPSAGGIRRSRPTSPAGRSRSGSTRSRADDELRATTRGLRGFFLADPEELSLIALVDEFASPATRPVPRKMYRIEGGNDRLATALAAPLGDRVRLNTEVVAVSHRGQERARQR